MVARVSDEEWKAFQTLAADNARLCGIVIAADALEKAIIKAIKGAGYNEGLERALEAYKISRTGH